MKKVIKRSIYLSIFFIFITIIVFLIYVSDYYHGDENAIKALESNDLVKVSKQDYGYFFDGYSDDNALIFYPGGKIECISYAPLLSELASNGIDVFLLEMPFNLAILDINKANIILDRYDYKNIYVGGHSFGGVISSMYAYDNYEYINGVILISSYANRKLNDDLEVILINGSEDKILTINDYEKNLINLPKNNKEYIIEGGNHSNFGSYGIQKGDGISNISHSKQINETVEIIINEMTNN